MMRTSGFVEAARMFFERYHGPFVKRLYAFDDVSSTNETARTLALQGAEEGVVVIARTQQKGRGRFDRVWESPQGGVYVSLVLRPDCPVERTSLLPLVAALAVTNAVRSFEMQAWIKWPNDVRVNKKKIAGILLESEVKGACVSYVVVGIGVNLNVDLSRLSPAIQHQSTSLSAEIGRPVDYFEFLSILFREFDRVYQVFSRGDFERIIKEWQDRSDTLGKQLRVQTADGIVQGVADGVDQDGFLRVRKADGSVQRVMSGDCSLLDES
jgi:BirA family biotin operon repressor/biotin-[acetyl-CoA-carboxylase] ligase